MGEKYKFVTPDGQEHAWKGKPSDLTKAHLGARITHREVMNEVTQEGTWEPYSLNKARADEHKAADPEARDSKAAKAEVVVEVEPAESGKR